MKKQLRKSEIREINEELKNLYGLENFFDKKDTIEKSGNLIICNDEALFFYYENTLAPTLKQCLKNCPLKSATVDMGAVKFVTGGADIMRPGITQAEDFKENDIVVVLDETNKKPLAVCRALYSKEELIKMQKGKVLKNIHYVGDEIWNA